MNPAAGSASRTDFKARLTSARAARVSLREARIDHVDVAALAAARGQTAEDRRNRDDRDHPRGSIVDGSRRRDDDEIGFGWRFESVRAAFHQVERLATQ